MILCDFFFFFCISNTQKSPFLVLQLNAVATLPVCCLTHPITASRSRVKWQSREKVADFLLISSGYWRPISNSSDQREGFSLNFKCLSNLCCHCCVASCLKLAVRQNQERWEKWEKSEVLLLPSPQELLPNSGKRAMVSPEDLFCLFFLCNSRIWTALGLN